MTLFMRRKHLDLASLSASLSGFMNITIPNNPITPLAVSLIPKRRLVSRDQTKRRLKRCYSNDNNIDIDFEKLLDNIRKERTFHGVTQTDKEDENIGRVKRKEVFTIDELVQFLRDKNAMDICVINVPPSLQYVTYFVTCTGSSSRHITSLAETLALEMKHVRILNDQRVIVEGTKSEEWLAVDIGHSVVHFMTEDTRDKYQLERLWSLGCDYDEQMQDIMTHNQLTQDN